MLIAKNPIFISRPRLTAFKFYQIILTKCREMENSEVRTSWSDTTVICHDFFLLWQYSFTWSQDKSHRHFSPGSSPFHLDPEEGMDPHHPASARRELQNHLLPDLVSTPNPCSCSRDGPEQEAHCSQANWHKSQLKCHSNSSVQGGCILWWWLCHRNIK